MDDPFFSAHYEVYQADNLTIFFADREATAMACLEQFQFCLSGPFSMASSMQKTAHDFRWRVKISFDHFLWAANTCVAAGYCSAMAATPISTGSVSGQRQVLSYLSVSSVTQ